MTNEQKETMNKRRKAGVIKALKECALSVYKCKQEGKMMFEFAMVQVELLIHILGKGHLLKGGAK